MTKHQLLLLLVGTWAYRWGWNVGARRMSAAISGRQVGIKTWPGRIVAARDNRRRQRKADEDESLLRFVRVVAPSSEAPIKEESTHPAPGSPTGQYL